MLTCLYIVIDLLLGLHSLSRCLFSCVRSGLSPALLDCLSLMLLPCYCGVSDWQFEEDGSDCHCRTATEKDCHVCLFTGGPANTSKTCKRCRNSRYYLSGKCLESCPEEMVSAG